LVRAVIHNFHKFIHRACEENYPRCACILYRTRAAAVHSLSARIGRHQQAATTGSEIAC
jgi:hypothetical protein